jgi:hypothetical protein
MAWLCGRGTNKTSAASPSSALGKLAASCGAGDVAGDDEGSGFNAADFNSDVDSFAAIETVTSVVRRETKQGKVVNDLLWQRTLGAGAFGKVKLTTHVRSKRPYAVKVVRKRTLQRKRLFGLGAPPPPPPTARAMTAIKVATTTTTTTTTTAMTTSNTDGEALSAAAEASAAEEALTEMPAAAGVQVEVAVVAIRNELDKFYASLDVLRHISGTPHANIVRAYWLVICECACTRDFVWN